jgi:Tol biopolymer transport system component
MLLKGMAPMLQTKFISRSLPVNLLYVLLYMLGSGLLGLAGINANAQVVINKKLTPPLLQGEIVGQVRLSPDGNWLVYYTEQALNNQLTLYSIPANGGEAYKIAETIISVNHPNATPHFIISPDSQWVVCPN